MNLRKVFTYLAPFTLVLVIAVFVYNIYSHGRIDHAGKTLYQAQCAQCHGDKGEGVQQLVPPLTDKGFIETHLDSIPCWLKNGMNHPIVVNGKAYEQIMYPNQLTDVQAANVINYITAEFAKADKPVNSAWVRHRWKECK